MHPQPYAALAVIAAFLSLTPTAATEINQPLAVLAPTFTQAQTPKGKVDIIFNGKVVTGQTQTVMIGQPINLTFTVSGGPSASVALWQVPFNVVGGWQASVDEAEVIPLPQNYRTQKNLTFYWIDQGPAKNLGLEYRLSNGELGRVSTTFDVKGPTNVKVTAQTTSKPGDPIEVGRVKFFDKDGIKHVGWGEGTQKSVGIIFNASATMPSGASGQFIWVQKINRDDFYYYDSHIPRTYFVRATGGVDVCTPEHCKTPDVTYQYDTRPVTADSPSSQLGSGRDVDITYRNFVATMFLMWQDLTDPHSIPVTLGTVNWDAYWYLKFVPESPDPGWTIVRSWVFATPFAPSIWHPVWEHKNTLQRIQ